MAIEPTKSKESLNVDDANVAGEIIQLGRLFYVLPPAPIVYMPRIQAVLRGGDFSTDEAYSNALIDAIYLSLRRNYKALSRDDVADNLDMTNFRDVMDAFMQVNNLQRVTTPGEAQGS